MKRIDEVDVVRAYKETGLIPVRQEWCSSNGRGACAIEAFARYTEGVCGEVWAARHLDTDYLVGFIDAWDSDSPDELEVQENRKSYLLGFWDAILCREAVIEEFTSTFEVEAS